MNVKSLLLLLSFTGLVASCSNDDLDGSADSTNPNGTRSEIQLTFKGKGESQEYKRTTKAIASEPENKIETLDIYLFAATAENGQYYFLEKWTEGTSYDPNAPSSTNFKLQESGTDKKASLYPNELKGLPYLKLLCVANNNVAGSTVVDGKFYAENGTTELLGAATTPKLTPVEVDADGVVSNASDATKVEDFSKTFTKEIGTSIIPTPLLMTGQGQTKISGSVSVVTIDLRRVVARFDIDNNTSTSQLTIEKVTMAQGRKTGALWGAAPTKEPDLAANTLVYLADYQPIDFTTIPDANKGLAQSALYVYPTLATDESYLIIEGTYKSPVTSAQVPVTYHVPIKRTAANAINAEYIPIAANNRYQFHITDVTQSNVFGTFEVEDWTSGGGIVTKPDNDAPVFTGADAFVAGDDPIALTDANGKVYGYEVATDADGNGSVTVQIAATGHVRAEKGAVTKAGETDWLSISSQTPEEKDGVWYTKFVLSYTNAIGQQPVAVNFINEAASYDPALWTTINFYGPKAVPSFALVANGNSKGNLSALANNADGNPDPKKPTASIYNAKGSYVQFDVTSIEGITYDALAGYKVEEVKTEGFVHTYKISVADASTAAGGNLVFKNAGDETKTTTLVITKLDPSLTGSEVTDADGVGDWVVGTETPYPTTGKLKIDLDALKEYVFKIEAAEGLTATNLNSCPWLTFEEDHAWQNADGQRYVQYKIKPKANPVNTDDFDLIFTNELAVPGIDAPGLTITVHKDFSKPKLAAGTVADWSDFNQGFAADASFTDPTVASINMYKVAGSKITVKMTCSEAAEFEAATGLTFTQVGGTGDVYEISIANESDANSITTPTTEVIAHNNDAYAADNSTDRKAKLTITWVDPAITFEFNAGGDGGGNAVIAGDNINVTYASLQDYTTPIVINITGYPGSAIIYSGNTATWLNQTTSPATLDNQGKAVITFMKGGAVDATATADIVINVKNGVTGGGDKTITLKKN